MAADGAMASKVRPACAINGERTGTQVPSAQGVGFQQGDPIIEPAQTRSAFVALPSQFSLLRTTLDAFEC